MIQVFQVKIQDDHSLEASPELEDELRMMGDTISPYDSSQQHYSLQDLSHNLQKALKDELSPHKTKEYRRLIQKQRVALPVAGMAYLFMLIPMMMLIMGQQRRNNVEAAAAASSQHTSNLALIAVVLLFVVAGYLLNFYHQQLTNAIGEYQLRRQALASLIFEAATRHYECSISSPVFIYRYHPRSCDEFLEVMIKANDTYNYTYSADADPTPTTGIMMLDTIIEADTSGTPSLDYIQMV